MFARGAQKLGAPAYRPHRLAWSSAGRSRRSPSARAAYAAILVAEEVLDVMQRDWMRDERVVPFVRTINNIHVGRGVAAHEVRPAPRPASTSPARAGCAAGSTPS
ncbi:diiron oxygenase [Streptomyces flavovirens]|uniref:diiron oxygenase n=1 Tax=Streptomyces flavovirens TaxID=52258 RepID=UPI0031EF7B84